MEWKMKDGQVIQIKDMDTRHLENAIRFIERKIYPYADELHRLDHFSLDKLIHLYERLVHFQTHEAFIYFSEKRQAMKDELARRPQFIPKRKANVTNVFTSIEELTQTNATLKEENRLLQATLNKVLIEVHDSLSRELAEEIKNRLY